MADPVLQQLFEPDAEFAVVVRHYHCVLQHVAVPLAPRQFRLENCAVVGRGVGALPHLGAVDVATAEHGDSRLICRGLLF
jgi:hypothetical protein